MWHTPFIRDASTRLSGLTFYTWFEQAVVLVVTVLIMLVVASATWHLGLAVFALVMANQLDPAKQQVFQAVFGMIFTVIIALEFKHSLLVVLARQESVVQVRSVVLIALLAVARKFIILDLREAAALQLFALAAAILALGLVYWLVRDQEDRRSFERHRRKPHGRPLQRQPGRAQRRAHPRRVPAQPPQPLEHPST